MAESRLLEYPVQRDYRCATMAVIIECVKHVSEP
jgi:hypothetical protein